MKKLILSMLIAIVMMAGMLPVTGHVHALEVENGTDDADGITVTIDTGASVTLQDADGDGYYDIGTPDELYAFAATVNGGNTAINGELTADIVVNENVLDEAGELNGTGDDFRVWTPIGNESIWYDGIFDGDEYTVSGLYFKNNSIKYVGLFGYVYNSGTVQNVGVKDFYFEGGEFHVGGVVGQNRGTVENCYNAGTVNGNKYLGGVVGQNRGTVANCHNAGTVNGSQWIGGVVGYNIGTVANCRNTGKINGNSYVGGVAGYNGSTITNCYNTGAVFVWSMSGGGVVGDNRGTVTNCYNAGTVKGSSDLGGVAGYNGGTITNCCNINTVWCQVMNPAVGGIVSRNKGTVTNCYNTGEIIGYRKFGGVAGENSDSGTITNCYYLAGSSEAGIGLNTANNESIISEVTEAQVKASSGEEGSLIDMLHEWVAEQNDVKYKGWHFCSNFSADYPSLNLAYTYSDNGENHFAKCTSCGSETTEAHMYFYTGSESVITESCKLCTHSASINLVLPEAPVYSGNAHEATYTGNFANPDATILIQYLRYNEDSETGYEILDSAPVDVGTYVVRFSVGGIYVDRNITIAPKAITLIGVEVEYKDYDGTPYVEIDTTYGYGGFKADGVLNYDSIKILCASAELESANAGTYDKVTVQGLAITGEDAHNYIVVSEATIPVYNIWGNYESSVTIYKKNVSIKLFDQEAGSLDAIDQSKWEIDEYYGLLEGHRIDSLKLVAEMNEGSTKYGMISVAEGSVKIVDADGNDVTANYGVSAYSATLTLTCPDHDEFEQGFCKNCGGYEKATYNENEGYYEIENAGQLFWFAEYVANVSNEANAKLIDNITIPEGKEWTPIYNLYGTFDGNYKTISGLNVSESDSNYVGFLGYVGYWADVRNLHISNSSFVDTDATYVGAIVGYHGGGEITNCYTDETVKVESNGVRGALAGFTYGTLKNCYAHDMLVGNGYYGSFENCYYIGEDDGTDGTTAITTEQFASGEVAYLLQAGQVGEPIWDEENEDYFYDNEGNYIYGEAPHIWGQTIGTETYPVFGGKKVYQVLNCKNETAYSNTNEDIGHKYENGICTVCDLVDTSNGPVITQQPTDASAKMGENYCVEVIAEGEGLTYQWYFKNEGSNSWFKSGVTDNTYDDVMTSARAGRKVYCVITDANGNSVQTDIATLIAIKSTELAITKQPNNASVKLGEMFNVEVLAEGDGLKYQWYWRQIGSKTWNVSGQRDKNYDAAMTKARHNREVYCVITDMWGNSAETNVVTITAIPNEVLAIVTQPTDATAAMGENYCVTVEAQGDGLTYTWYLKNAGSDIWYKSGVTDNTYDDVMIKSRAGRQVYCVVTDIWGNSVKTNPVVIIMATQKHELAITAQPEDASARMDEMFCVTVEAQGDGLKYQWYWRQIGSKTWNVSGQRDNTYDAAMTKARHNREVYCVITDMWGNSAETNVVTITAITNEVLAIVTQPTDATAAMGENYCVTVEAQGDGLTYTWYLKNAGSDIWYKSGVTDNTYDDVMIKSRAGRQVYCVVTDIWGNSVTTETVTLICTDGN